MSQYNDSGYVTITLTATVAQNLRVTAGGAVAVLATRAIGIATRDGVSGDEIAVALLSKQGTVKMVASKSIAAGALVYSVAAGKISDAAASTSFLQGIAVEAATANNDVIEVYPIFGQVATA